MVEMDEDPVVENERLNIGCFDLLPEEIIIKILAYLSPYTDARNAKLVNRCWHRLLTANEKYCRRIYEDGLKGYDIMWKIRKQKSYDITETLLPGCGRSNYRRKVPRLNRNIPCPRFSHASVILGSYMYVFCGSSSETNTSSTFNDLYKLDLSNQTWQKISPAGLLPAPRECCTMVGMTRLPWKLIVYGGWCQPPTGRTLNAPRFFDDTQILSIEEMKWQRVNVNDKYPSARAGHSASVIKTKMIIFGGSQRSNRLNDVWIFNAETLSWSCPYVRGKKPKERFGQSQFTINEKLIMILGGCGGPHELCGDVWLFDVERCDWSKLIVENQLYEPPDLWCHASVFVNDHVVVFSEEKKCPYCECPIQNYTVPTEIPIVGSSVCSCGRMIASDRVQVTQTRLQMYLLNCQHMLSKSTCQWEPHKYLSPSPPARRLFSANPGINEIIIFGGLQNESTVDDCTIVISAKNVLK